MRRFNDEDLTGAEFRECDLSRARMVGVVMQDAQIDGLVTNLVVNGVEVMDYVEAELDRRHPVRVLIRSDEPADLQEAHRRLMSDWAETIERMRATPGIVHRSAHDEWSAVQTLRHLVFVHDSWFRRCVLGSTAMFFYVLHVHLLELAAVALGLRSKLGLGASYLAAAVCVLVLYVPCAHYFRYKAARSNWFTSLV